MLELSTITTGTFEASLNGKGQAKEGAHTTTQKGTFGFERGTVEDERDTVA